MPDGLASDFLQRLSRNALHEVVWKERSIVGARDFNVQENFFGKYLTGPVRGG
jgi:hypothetical protein